MRSRSFLSALTFALAGCLPSQFDDLSASEQAREPSTACDAGGPDCPQTTPDAGSAPSDAAMPRDAGVPFPPKDAGAPPDAGPRDAGVVDAGPPPPSPKDWPPETEMVETPPFMGCVYIEICTHEKTGGAVCRLHTGCQIDANTRAECLANLSVCGTPKKPIFFCDRRSKNCITP